MLLAPLCVSPAQVLELQPHREPRPWDSCHVVAEAAEAPSPSLSTTVRQ